MVRGAVTWIAVCWRDGILGRAKSGESTAYENFA
jgi:hypothetical protein